MKVGVVDDRDWICCCRGGLLLTRQESICDAGNIADTGGIDAVRGESRLVRRGPTEREGSAPGCLGTAFKEGGRGRGSFAGSDELSPRGFAEGLTALTASSITAIASFSFNNK